MFPPSLFWGTKTPNMSLCLPFVHSCIYPLEKCVVRASHITLQYLNFFRQDTVLRGRHGMNNVWVVLLDPHAFPNTPCAKTIRKPTCT